MSGSLYEPVLLFFSMKPKSFTDGGCLFLPPTGMNLRLKVKLQSFADIISVPVNYTPEPFVTA